MAGVYGYVVANAAQTRYDFSSCTDNSTIDTLPTCIPSDTVNETGSALMFPMFKLWAQNFSQLYPDLQINPANTGSGAGISSVEKGLTHIGGSAIYLDSDAQARFPNVLSIPLAITADIIEYYIPGFDTATNARIHLNFTATLLAQIYNGTVLTWNDQRIKQINPGAASILPSSLIYPTYRSDASGDTYLFTQYLSFGDSWWANNVTYGLQVHWPSGCLQSGCPVNQPQSALGNPGIVLVTGARPGSLSYVSVEALDQWVLCKTLDPLCAAWGPTGTYSLGFGFLQNSYGNFVEANQANIQASIDALAPQTPPDGRFSLAFAPGPSSYPIVGYGYALVNKVQINQEFAFVIRTFLKYCLLPEYGNSNDFLSTYHFNALPSVVDQQSLAQVAEIGP